MPGAGGVVVGPIWRYAGGTGGGTAGSTAAGAHGARARAGTEGPDHAAAPAAAIRAAADEAESQLEALAARMRDLGRGDEAGIFDAQAMMATDPELLDAAVAGVQAGADPAASVTAAAAAAAATLAALPDELLAARAADVRDVGARIVRIMNGVAMDLPDARCAPLRRPGLRAA